MLSSFTSSPNSFKRQLSKNYVYNCTVGPITYRTIECLKEKVKKNETKDKSPIIPPALYTYTSFLPSSGGVYFSSFWIWTVMATCNNQPNTAEVAIKEATMLHRSGLACCERGLQERTSRKKGHKMKNQGFLTISQRWDKTSGALEPCPATTWMELHEVSQLTPCGAKEPLSTPTTL